MSTAPKKPTVVLVPGAWHRASQYSPLTTRLEGAGYEVHGIDYPSTGPNPTNTSFDPDVALVSTTIAKLADRGRDVLLAVHSAGGIIGSEAAKGLSATDRAKEGKPGGIMHIVYICAFALVEGVSLWDLQREPLTWQILEEPHISVRSPEAAVQTFYQLCDPEVAMENAKQLFKFAVGTLRSKPTYAAWKHIPSSYLICENDNGIPLAGQEAMASQPGANFTLYRCKADHSPFLCMPDYTARVVRRAAGEAVEVV